MAAGSLDWVAEWGSCGMGSHGGLLGYICEVPSRPGQPRVVSEGVVSPQRSCPVAWRA